MLRRLQLPSPGGRVLGRVMRPCHLAAISLFTLAPSIALAAPPADQPAAQPQAQESLFIQWVHYLQGVLPAGVIDAGLQLVFGLLVFVLGWVAAKFLSWVVFRVLCKTDLDDKLATKLGIKLLLEDRKNASKSAPNSLERGVAQVVYYLLMALVVVGVLEVAGLKQAAAPIQRLVDTLIQALPVIGKGVAILVIAYIAGLILRKIVTKFLDVASVDKRFAELQDEPEEGADQAKPFSETAGQVVFWVVMLMGLTGAFDALGIEAISTPLSHAVDSLMNLLPALGIAALIGLGGWVLAKIARTVVSSALETLGFDKLVARVKLDNLFGDSTPSKVAGWLAQAFILIQTAIAALHRVGLSTLSDPMTDMMAQFWELLPALLLSVVFIVLGVFVGRLLRGIAQNTLESVGFDRLMDRIGFGKIAERDDDLAKPSGLIGFVLQVGVVLLAVVQGLNNLALDSWAGYVDAFLVFAVTQAAVALLIVGVGFTVGNYVRDLIEARQRGDKPEAEASEGQDADTSPVWMAEFARYAVLVFTFTMAVHQLGIAEDFVLLTFGLLFGALCLAGALAIGLGARETAGEIVRERYRQSRSGSASAGKGSSASGLFSSSLKKPPGK